MLDDLFLLPELDVMEHRARHLHAEKPLVRQHVPVVRQDKIQTVDMSLLRVPPHSEDDVAHNLSYLVFAVTQRTVTNREEGSRGVIGGSQREREEVNCVGERAFCWAASNDRYHH
ncbi:Hypothetical protein, putative [Bodo saltans]|uniref:Uncharacterized protein n=1 Tax=Bodo saltans TaxID=75058 RepID=A0A0S4IQC0_BODSA|nr:Hypothetical protein, putative [Bodo saltans]|eukprot:CUF13940.1 Hypothetical protein, putative [Bodo saltans]